MKPILLALAATAAISLSACAGLLPAEMARPANLATATTTPITGIGGGERGAYAVGPNAGVFQRSTQEVSFFNLGMKDGAASFSLKGADFAQGFDVACTMRERTITIDFVELKPAPMALGCDVRANGQPAAAMIEIQESAPDLTNREQRRGVVMLDGARLDIRSVHDMAGGILSAAAPLGYVFERNGVAVGGVDINAGPTVIEAPGLTPAERQAVLLAAIALSVFWDPAVTGV